ncbi:AI-2E family transporter [Falsiroseomonas bella]|uniref:AI-2E family transporter n=1 Tax=Falsiroseomonas bella TaxID=2184016 RepID=UPI001304FA86|nr:AI-2E family transporter [Falsiroseomonas bella]
MDEDAARIRRDEGRPAAGAWSGGGWRGEVAFLRRTLIVAGVVILLLLLWTVRGALLLAFAAMLVAVLVRAVADPLHDRLRLPPRIAVLAACLLVGTPLVLAAVLVGSEMQAQVMLLLENLPEAAAAIEREFGIRIPLPGGDGPSGSTDASTVGAVARQAASAALLAVDALAALVIVVVGGIYFAADPGLYRRGIARLLPRAQQARARDALDATGRALRLWLLAQLAAMTAVGTLTGLGAWAIGLPAPLALGLFAGLVDIVPLIGPFIGALPGVLLAFNMGWEMLAWTAALYILVQQIEGNILTPLLGERMVSIPSALLLFAVVAAGAALGLGGVLLAAPLTVVVVVLVGKLYVRETLGQRVEVPGEEE